MNFCHSCTAPLDMPQFQSATLNLCKHCVDDKGILLPRADVQKGIAHWFKSWQPGLDDAKALRRADIFMQAMPAWAKD